MPVLNADHLPCSIRFPIPMNRSLSILVTVTCLPLFLAGCQTPGQTALLGAGVGAATASATGYSALRGAGIGAAAGALVGVVAQDQRRRAYAEGYYAGRGGYPIANRTSRSGYVRSPYSPYNLIDVRGIPHGARVVDPSTDKIFINP